MGVKLKSFQMNYFVIITIIGLVVGKVSADYMQDSWEEPNAWGRHSPSGSVPNVCPVCDLPAAKLEMTFYKKLAANLFNKNSLKKNEYSGQLETTIFFTVSNAQLEVIEKSTDIRDLDASITEILKAAKVVKSNCAGKESGSVLWLIKDMIIDIALLFANPEIRFISLVIGAVILTWFIHKRYKKNFISVVIIGVFLVGYFCTYLECNYKLEVDKLVAFAKENETEQRGWIMNLVNSILRTTKKDDQISKIRAASKLNLQFCRPDTVLIMYINEMFLNQLQLIIEKCGSMIMTFKNGMAFPYNIIAMIFVPFLFAFMTRLVFKYLINPSIWFKIFWSEKPTTSNQSQQQQSQNTSNEDRITGANLQLLLQAFAKHNPKREALLSSSGVEEIMEFLENGSADSKSEESKNENDDEKSMPCLNKIEEEKLKKDS